METKEIEKIIKIFETAKISHLELEVDNIKIKLDKELKESPVSKVNTLDTVEESFKEQAKEEKNKNGLYVTSPLVGIYYEAQSEGAKPFVKVGDKVKKGDKLCIIEAMKVMNEITSPYDGVIKEIYFKNKTMVEFSSKLFRIEG